MVEAENNVIAKLQAGGAEQAPPHSLSTCGSVPASTSVQLDEDTGDQVPALDQVEVLVYSTEIVSDESP